VESDSGVNSHRRKSNKKDFSHIEQRWYQDSPGILRVLKPLECLFGRIAKRRRHQLKKQSYLPPVPTIIVGNISVGGTGKTPVVIQLVRYLKEKGYKPGVVSRGYGRKSQGLKIVESDSDVHDVGDEPLLIFKETQCPVIVCADRALAAQTLVEQTNIDLIVSDDGLQHYRLDRHIEIAIVDGQRLFGNGHCLPVGPLREPIERLNDVHCIIVTNSNQNDSLQAPLLLERSLSSIEKPVFHARVQAVRWHSVCGDKQLSLDAFTHKETHAVAGIGQPQKFFQSLAALNIVFEVHEFPDHYCYQKADFNFLSDKSEIKCRDFDLPNAWYLEISLQLPADFFTALDAWLKKF